MILKGLKIGDKTSLYPIIQGGMGIGVSGSCLAGNVAKEGGIGILSGASIGFLEPDYDKNPNEANLRAIDNEIDKARKISKKGILGMNIMVAMNNYVDLVKRAVKKGIDLIVSGAGIPKELPKLVEGTKTKIAPIISSVRAAKLIIKLWTTKYNYVPDMIVVEGPLAGGHLGFNADDLANNKAQSLEEITVEVVAEMRKFEEENGIKIPVIVAGGIYDGNDIAKFLKLGADGVQMGTRFIGTYECDASDSYKQAYINAKQEDIVLVKSPVGMPGRAIKNKFINDVAENKVPIKKCYRCIVPCDPKNSPYCITKALTNAFRGNTDEGLLFCGSNAYRINKLVSVKELFNELVGETELALNTI